MQLAQSGNFNTLSRVHTEGLDLCVVVKKLFDVQFDVVASQRLMFMEVTTEIGVDLCASGVGRVEKCPSSMQTARSSDVYAVVCRQSRVTSVAYFYRSGIKFGEQDSPESSVASRCTVAPSFVMHLESASGVKITRPTLWNEIVNSTMRAVHFVVGGVVNPVIIALFVDGWLWRQLKMSDIKDPAKQRCLVQVVDEKGPFDEVIL